MNIGGFSKNKKKMYFENLKKKRKEEERNQIGKNLKFKIKTFFKHPKYLKIQKDFNRVNDFVK
jgi:hypothetical protein